MDRRRQLAIEEALFAAFIVPSKKQRYVELIRSKRGREKIRLSLDHFSDLDDRSCERLNPNEASLPGILKKLRDLGAPSTCYLVSSDADLDGQAMDLAEALDAVIGRGMGTFISCIPGKLAYFESEERNERYICSIPEARRRRNRRTE